MVELIEKTRCTGCKMCADACPQNAICFETNENGFWYPKVDREKCIGCNLCIRKCPVSCKDKFDTSRTLYAAWSRDDQVRREGTSGGIYYEFAKYVLEQGGILVGCSYTDDYMGSFHMIVDDMNGLDKLKGSKYFQSDTKGIYKKTESALKTGRQVLFSGTPCQIVSLKSYLNQEYDNLLTMDFICRGVPSPYLHKQKIELYQKKAKSKVTFYQDKSKVVGWENFGELIKFENGKTKFISRWIDEINNCFIEKNLNLRESCYICPYKNGNNASDITVGDFWGIKGVTERDRIYGVSVLITNTEKGNHFISMIKDRVYTEERPLSEVGEKNQAYLNAVKRPQNKDDFFKCVDNHGLEKAVKEYTHRSIVTRLKMEGFVFKGRLFAYKSIIKDFFKISWGKFIRINFLTKSVHREGTAYIVPYRGTVIQIGRKAHVNIKANVVLNCYPTYKRGKQTTLFKIANGARLIVNNRLEIAYGNTFALGPNAEMKIGYFYSGVNANVICNYKMSIGNNIMIGRDVCIFDSDYHKIYDQNGNKINLDKEVVIEDNVWIGARSMVLKGAHIHAGAIVSANSMVLGEVEGGKVFLNKRDAKSVGGNIVWER